MTGNNFLQIDPNAHFNGSARHYDDLPENFLETVSPHGSGQTIQLNISHHDATNAHISGIGNMNVAPTEFVYTEMDPSESPLYFSYASLIPISGGNYVPTLKMETMEPIRNSHAGPLEKFHRFNTGTAGLLSPLQLDNRVDHGGLLGMSRPNGRASEMLSSLRTSNYVKEEMISDMGLPQEYDGGAFLLHQPSQQELERMTMATPPAISGDIMVNHPGPELQVVHYDVTTSQPYESTPLPPPPPPQSTQNPPTRRRRQKAVSNTQKDFAGEQSTADAPPPRQSKASSNVVSGASVPRAVYSTSDASDPLNAEIDDDIYIDTKDLCKRIAYELKQHSIPQAIFAERILCRSQGTLSDLLRNPKPWNRLKSGRETFRRMFNWVQQPVHVRLSILDMYKGPAASTPAAVLSPPTPAQNARQNPRTRPAAAVDESSGGSAAKRPRLVFTDIQKRTLQAIFKETQRPSREMQQTIAEHLRLDMSTVSNFFMNARRRSRNGSVVEDEPAPYQHIRPITPPPESPSGSQRQSQSRARSYKSPGHGSAHSMPEHIEASVAAVAHGTASFDPARDVIVSDDAYSDMMEGGMEMLDDGHSNGDWDDDSGNVKGSASDFNFAQLVAGAHEQAKQAAAAGPASVPPRAAKDGGVGTGAPTSRSVSPLEPKEGTGAPSSV